MPEQINLQPRLDQPLSTEVEQIDRALSDEGATSFNPERSIDRFNGFVDSTLMPSGVLQGPEHSESVKQAAHELIGKYELGEDLFQDSGRSLMFAAIASRWAGKGEDRHEDIFLEDALTLLAHDHSPKLSEVYDYARPERDKQDDALLQNVYDRFTDRPMSAELRSAMENGLLKDVKERLKLSPDTEDEFDVRVLSISTAMSAYGLEGPSVSDIQIPETPGYNPEYAQKVNGIIKARDTAAEWRKGLERRAEQFYIALGYDKKEATTLPPAWITTIHGKKQLCIPMPVAEKVLRPEITAGSKLYDEDTAARDKATIEHEFTHTQGGLNIDSGLDFGISLEELRAEDYSGNKQGYQDIKGFAIDLGIISGKILSGYFKGKEKGGNAFEVWSEIAKDFGIDQMLEIAMVRPKAYDDNQSNLINKMVAEHLGGFDGVTRRIYERSIAAGKKQAAQDIEGRLTKAAERVVDNSKTEDFPDFYVNHRRSLGLRFVSDMLEPKIKEAKLKSSQKK